MLLLLILVQILFNPGFLCQSAINLSNIDRLISIAVIYRHGDRTPINPYPKDPYRNESYWPVGFGQLTNIGKMEQYQLGQWLRERYKDFLPEKYSEKDIYVHSTDSDRTLMSAEVNLAGLYPPHGNEVWAKGFNWQPIPVHTVSTKNEYILSGNTSCPRYDSLIKSLMSTPEFVDIHKKNHDLYAYLARNAGTSILNLKDLEYLYNILYVENLYNFSLPEWTKKVFPSKMQPWADFSFAIPCYTRDLAKLKTGPFFNEIIEHFTNSTLGKGYKMLAYSAHDTNIANILMALEKFDYHSPPYSATIMFELRYSNEYYVNIFYKNTTIPQPLTLKDCTFNCPLDTFLNILKPIALNYDEWEDECQVKFLGVLPFTALQTSIFTSCLVVFTLLLIVLLFSIIFANRRNIRQNYFRIPNEDV